MSSQAACEERALDRMETVAIIGVGLIGGSIGLALRSEGLRREWWGWDEISRKLEEARARAFSTRRRPSSEGVAEAEVVVVCTPVSRIGTTCAGRPGGRAGVLVTDAGSTKRQIVETVESPPAAADVFVGAHPIAGSERSGAAHARAGCSCTTASAC